MMCELLQFCYYKVNIEVLRNYFICRNLSYIEYEVISNIRDIIKKVMVIFLMRRFKNCVWFIFIFQILFLKVLSFWRVFLISLYLLVFFNIQRNFLLEFFIIWNYFCICLFVDCFNRFKFYEERDSVFFIYYLLLYISIVIIINMNNNNIVVLGLVLYKYFCIYGVQKEDGGWSGRFFVFVILIKIIVK